MSTGSSRVEQVTTPDGPFDVTVWLPEAGSGPGILLIQEIYGVSDYIRAVAGDLAALGYVTGAPDMFWRLQPGYQARHDEEGLKESLGLASRFDWETGIADAGEALRHLSALPEVTGGTGVMGFCFGGTVAFLLAARSDPATAVSFYGSGVPDNLEQFDRIRCPLLLHFGGSDPYIPREKVAQVEDAASGRPRAEIHVQEEAGHAFHNRKAPMFHQPGPAASAWQVTEEFLGRTLPVR
jgi:carboxymethylenebutenolidase